MSQRNRTAPPRDAIGRPMRPASMDVDPAVADGVLQEVYQPVEAEYALTVPGVTNFYAVPPSAALGASATSAAQTIKFTDSGKIVCMVADIINPQAISVAQTPEAARCILGISVISGVTKAQIFSNGDSEQPISIAQLFGGQLQRVFPLVIPVRALDTWQVKFTNFSAVLTGLIGQLSFGFISDRQYR
jgi:hypothetical protein